jgi:hypothetical protein
MNSKIDLDQHSARGGGLVEDILNRLSKLEAGLSEFKAQVSAILAVNPHLATKADVIGVRTELAQLRWEMAARLSGAAVTRPSVLPRR